MAGTIGERDLCKRNILNRRTKAMAKSKPTDSPAGKASPFVNGEVIQITVAFAVQA